MTTQIKEKLRDKIVTISASVIGSVLLMFLGLYATGIASDRKEQREEISRKVNKTDFEKHCTENVILFEKMSNRQDEQLSKINETLSKMLEQNAKISTDVDWIKKKVK